MITITLNRLIEVYNALLSDKLPRSYVESWACELLQHEENGSLLYEPSAQEELIRELLYNLFGCDERLPEDRARMIWTNEDIVEFLTEMGFRMESGLIVPEEIRYASKMHLRKITHLFDHSTAVFRVINRTETTRPEEYLFEDTDYALIPEEKQGYFFIKALRISASGIEKCFMDMQTEGRKSKWVVRRQTGRTVSVEEIGRQEAASVIPAIASEQYGKNADLYFAEKNPWVGIHVLKSGLPLARNKDVVRNDLYALKNRIRELRKTGEIIGGESLSGKMSRSKKR